MEIPAQMRAMELAWPSRFRPRCKVCRRRLHRVLQIDGTVIHCCGSGCRNELGLPFCAEQAQQHPQAQHTKPPERVAA